MSNSANPQVTDDIELSLYRIVAALLPHEQENFELLQEQQENTDSHICRDLIRIDYWLQAPRQAITPQLPTPAPALNSISTADLRSRFPWLGTDEDAGSGADVIESLADWYEQLTNTSTDPADVLVARALAIDLAPEDLDEAVHDAAGYAASTANNSGIEEQIRFLVANGSPEVAESLIREAALSVANYDHTSRCFPLAEYPRELPASQYEGPTSLWSAMSDGIITHEQARDIAIRVHERGTFLRNRWLAHFSNRLEYERAMLAESGGLAADRFDIQVGGRVLIGSE
jgi:hypothetical protein